MEAVKLQHHPETDYRKTYTWSADGKITSYYTPDGVLHKCPEGYMTGEEFLKQGIENINKFCKEHGLL